LSKNKCLVKIDCENSRIDFEKIKLNAVVYDLHSIVIVQIHFILDVKEE